MATGMDCRATRSGNGLNSPSLSLTRPHLISCAIGLDRKRVPGRIDDIVIAEDEHGLGCPLQNRDRGGQPVRPPEVIVVQNRYVPSTGSRYRGQMVSLNTQVFSPVEHGPDAGDVLLGMIEGMNAARSSWNVSRWLAVIKAALKPRLASQKRRRCRLRSCWVRTERCRPSHARNRTINSLTVGSCADVGRA
jgi:hypothetical protein